MEKLSNIAKGLDTFLKVIGRILFVAGCIAVTALLVFVCAGFFVEMPIEASSVSVGTLTLNLATGYQVAQNVIVTECVVALVVVAVKVAAICYGIKIFRRILSPMKDASPFVGTASGDLKKLGWVIIISGAISAIVKNVGESIMHSMYHLEEMFVPEAVAGYEISYQMDMTFIVVSVIVFLLSYVFRYGEELQKQADETL